MMQPWVPAYIGVGSNLGSPIDQVSSAFDRLAKLPDSRLVVSSGLYRSAPMGPQDQPAYINAVAAMLTQLSPEALLEQLQEIETGQGRIRVAERWGPRTIDLDLLAYGRLLMEQEHLVLPHPGIAERIFVLLPWSEIAPHFEIPGLGCVETLTAACVAAGHQIERIQQATRHAD